MGADGTDRGVKCKVEGIRARSEYVRGEDSSGEG